MDSKGNIATYLLGCLSLHQYLYIGWEGPDTEAISHFELKIMVGNTNQKLKQWDRNLVKSTEIGINYLTQKEIKIESCRF